MVADNLYSLYKEIDHCLNLDSKPSCFLDKASERAEFAKHPFNMLLKLKDTKQSPKYHPEGSTWNHTLMVVDEAAARKEKSTNKRGFMWAALLHDIGKPLATKIRKGKITAYDHDRIGAKLAQEFLMFFGEDEKFVKEVSSLVRWHMQILYVTKNLPFKKIEQMKSEVDIGDIALLGLCDRLGRGGADKKLEEENIEKFLKTVKLK